MKTVLLPLLGFACLPASARLTAADSVPPPPVVAAATVEDTPCRILEGAKPQFPVRMLKQGVSHGTVRVLIHVDAAGQVGDTLVTAYSRRAFADEALRVIEKWRFKAARAKGQPIDTILDLTFQFEVGDVLLVQKFAPDERKPEPSFDGFEFAATNLQKLDRLPTPLNVVEPTYPQEWIKAGRVGRIAVDFYIDETGKARFAAARPEADEQLAGIAVAAVQKWRFAPPTAKGKPVLVKVRQVFAFGVD